MAKKRGKSKSTNQATSESTNGKGNSSSSDAVAAALSTTYQAVFLKVCRLCETKDGPFLNIFDADKVTAKKIDELMPFGVTENDDLPHKICFRCSAKVEELHEFIQKCINTQHSLRKAIGKKEPLVIKPKTRALWEEKLNKSNMSNDDICDALIMKAMEGIKDIPLTPLLSDDEKTPVKKESKPPTVAPKKDTTIKVQADKDSVESESESDAKETSESSTVSKFLPTRVSRSKNATDNLLDGLQDIKRKKLPGKQNEKISVDNYTPVSINLNNLSFDYDGPTKADKKPEVKTELKPKQQETKPAEEPKKSFDIMDHVSMIKVNSVGVLFQCSLCNRNFLKKELVMTHGCAKSGGVPKVDFTKKIIAPAPPKISVVKYINTKVDNELKKPVESKFDNIIKPEVEIKKAPVETKPKPKIGPASKVKRQDQNCDSVIGMTVVPLEVNSPPVKPAFVNNVAAPSIQFPSLPSLNSRYKLVPGPNNSFQLVEEPATLEPAPLEPAALEPEVVQKSETGPKSRKRKSDPPVKEVANNKSKPVEVINIDDDQAVKPTNTGNKPYPVGLFQTLPHHSGMYNQQEPAGPPFTTPAMKKQSYTVVQTGNPSKLLISSKPQLPPEEPTKKKAKKSKPEAKGKGTNKEPFTVTLEDETPGKAPGFFTFINVDPLLQPSYVLPTDNIIQESQISTSTPLAKTAIDNNSNKDKDKYPCNMCGESFTREKKLLSHIQSHYNKMDEEDQMRAGNSRKRSGRKH